MHHDVCNKCLHLLIDKQTDNKLFEFINIIQLINYLNVLSCLHQFMMVFNSNQSIQSNIFFKNYECKAHKTSKKENLLLKIL